MTSAGQLQAIQILSRQLEQLEQTLESLGQTTPNPDDPSDFDIFCCSLRALLPTATLLLARAQRSAQTTIDQRRRSQPSMTAGITPALAS